MKDQKQLFSIRKFKSGVSSVVIASLFFTTLANTPALADSETMHPSSTKTQETAPSLANNTSYDALHSKTTSNVQTLNSENKMTSHVQNQNTNTEQVKKHQH
ncbi:YSIRK-type signal peptide-containing protein [Staphylococcus delphini]|uniref:YSIRK-type signal peptide-containing protein n=1 Tax=Staphylococcus delphini TaxID=53344 RepID=UPI0033650C25